MTNKMSKLSIVSFIMFIISGGGAVLAELCWESIHGMENAMYFAYLVVFVFYPCILISFILSLISVIRIVLYKQKGIVFALLTFILSASLMIWAMISDSMPVGSEYYAPTVSGESESS